MRQYNIRGSSCSPCSSSHIFVRSTTIPDLLGKKNARETLARFLLLTTVDQFAPVENDQVLLMEEPSRAPLNVAVYVVFGLSGASGSRNAIPGLSALLTSAVAEAVE